ncbi:MAG: nucleoside-diphosphate kinase [Candidatus Micrarchaeota archaeon]|nr:nucleoside-diphosphate kinase [Candidatus Micrarchaeota archaeon]
MAVERTLILLKPDTVQRGLVGQVLTRLEVRGLQIVGMKMIVLDKAKCDEHYAHLTAKPFYPSIVSFMTSAPVVALVAQGPEAVRVLRDMCGPTNARNALPGTIRGDLALSTQYNIIHASDSVETAAKEVARFFKHEELHNWNRTLDPLTAGADEKK